MSIKIDKGVPIPKAKRGRNGRYPFGNMGVGDSFYISDEDMDRNRNKVYSAASYYQKRNPKYKFITRVEKDGVRVWRVECE